jgi:hypothetical protein
VTVKNAWVGRGVESASGERRAGRGRAGPQPRPNLFFSFFWFSSLQLPSICRPMAFSPFLFLNTVQYSTELEYALARSNCGMDQEHPLVRSPSLPLYYPVMRSSLFSRFGDVWSPTLRHHSLPSLFNFSAQYFNVLSPRDYEVRTLRSCHPSYDTLNPGHCVSFSLWVYLFILSSRFREKVSSIATPT